MDSGDDSGLEDIIDDIVGIKKHLGELNNPGDQKSAAAGRSRLTQLYRLEYSNSVLYPVPFHSSVEVLPMLPAVSTTVLWYYEVIPPQT